jgi:hypothetical protein
MTPSQQLPLLDVTPPGPALFVAPCQCGALCGDACVCGPFLSDLEDDDDDE